ncbi:MAG: MATE family efflux transporter [Bacteroidales bacterium]|nr:MATE family efflux transporter [Bacteroidales bacterium]
MKDLTKGNTTKLILQFAAPMLLGNVFQQLYNIIDSIIVGKFIGKEALAAVGASFPIIFTLISFVIGISMGFTIIISQYFGAKNLEKVRSTIETMYIFLFGAAIIISILGMLLSKQIFIWTGLPEDILPQATLYLNVYFGGIIFFFGFNGTSSILRGLGDSKTPLYFLIISTVMNIVLDLLFIVGFGWGVEGAAIATILAQGGAFVTAIIYINRTNELTSLKTWRLKFDKLIFRKSLKIGLPSGLQQTFVSLGMIALFWIVNGFGTDTVAAYSVAMRIDSLASMPAMNFAAALTTFVGQNLGANRSDRIKLGLISTLKMSSLVCILLTIVIVIFKKPLMMLFTNDITVIEIGAEYLVIVSSFYLVFTSLFIFGAIMRGAGDTIVPMFITLFALWAIRIPVALFLSKQIGVVGIWWAIPIGWAIGLLFSAIYYSTGRWKSKAVVQHN